MKLNKLVLALLLTLLPQANAAHNVQAIKCRTIPWVVTRQLSMRDLYLEFRRLPRNMVIQIAWDEVMHEHADSLAMPLLHYLAYTSPKGPERDYFEALGYLANGEITPSEAVAQWPKRVKTKVLPLKLKRICDLYHEVSLNPVK